MWRGGDYVRGRLAFCYLLRSGHACYWMVERGELRLLLVASTCGVCCCRYVYPFRCGDCCLFCFDCFVHLHLHLFFTSSSLLLSAIVRSCVVVTRLLLLLLCGRRLQIATLEGTVLSSEDLPPAREKVARAGRR